MAARIELEGLGWIYFDGLTDGVPVGGRLFPSELRVHFPGAANQPELRMHLAIIDGIPQCRSLTIESKPGSREVRTLDLRAVALEDLIEQLYGLTEIIVKDDGLGNSTIGIHSWDEQALRNTERTIQKARATARRTITPELLAEVAEVYRANISDRPVEHVRKVFGGSYRKAAGYVQEARKRGLLPPTTRGKAAG